MIKSNVANFIVHDLSKKTKNQEGFVVNSSVISDIVEGWDKNVYIIPNNAINFNKKEYKIYDIM